jgi:hypothetical protein
MLLISEGQAGKSWECLNKPALFRKSGPLVENFLTLFKRLINFYRGGVSTYFVKRGVGSTGTDGIYK